MAIESECHSHDCGRVQIIYSLTGAAKRSAFGLILRGMNPSMQCAEGFEGTGVD